MTIHEKKLIQDKKAAADQANMDDQGSATQDKKAEVDQAREDDQGSATQDKKAEVDQAKEDDQGQKKAEKHFRQEPEKVFGRYDQSVRELYYTSDGTCFLSKQYARMHAETLEDNKIETVKRKD